MAVRDYQITLKSLRFEALVGIHAHERITPQPIEIDVVLGVSGPTIVDYQEVYRIVERVMERTPIDYLEDVADRVADDCLAHSAQVRHVRVAVRKPEVVLGGPLAYAEVTVELAAPGHA